MENFSLSLINPSVWVFKVQCNYHNIKKKKTVQCKHKRPEGYILNGSAWTIPPSEGNTGVEGVLDLWQHDSPSISSTSAPQQPLGNMYLMGLFQTNDPTWFWHVTTLIFECNLRLAWHLLVKNNVFCSVIVNRIPYVNKSRKCTVGYK